MLGTHTHTITLVVNGVSIQRCLECVAVKTNVVDSQQFHFSRSLNSKRNIKKKQNTTICWILIAVIVCIQQWILRRHENVINHLIKMIFKFNINITRTDRERAKESERDAWIPNRLLVAVCSISVLIFQYWIVNSFCEKLKFKIANHDYHLVVRWFAMLLLFGLTISFVFPSSWPFFPFAVTLDAQLF